MREVDTVTIPDAKENANCAFGINTDKNIV